MPNLPQTPGLRARLAFLCAALVCLFAPINVAHAATINVPADRPTIQAGINAANPGDTVLVAPGTYLENIDFKGKAITVTSSAGAATTILDGANGLKPAVFFVTNETRSSILNGFTIQHGGQELYYGQMGGISIGQSAPTLTNNIITHNHCYGLIVNGSPLIQNNEISFTDDAGWMCSFAGGAGIWLSGGYVAGLSPEIIGNKIHDNTRSGTEDAGGNGGAGLAIWGGNPIVQNNIFYNNKTYGQGGAINVEGGGGLIIQNLIYGNSAGGGGGAIATDSGGNGPITLYIANNTIANNVFGGGGGFSNDQSIAQIYYGTMDSIGSSTVTVNNILYGDTTEPTINCGWGIYYQGFAENTLIFDHNLFFNSRGQIFGPYCKNEIGRYGNISANPLFVNPAAGDFHLQAASPAIDAGNTSALQYLRQNGVNLVNDLGGSPRLADVKGIGYPVLDMGAYEYAGVQNANATTILLTPSAYTVDGGTRLTLSARLLSANGVPTGSLDFEEDGSSIGSQTIDATGSATLFTAGLVPGVHDFVAIYRGEGGFTPATSVKVIVVVNIYGVSLTITSVPNPSIVGQSVTFTIHASSTESGFIPSPLSLTDNYGTPFLTLTPDSTGTATYTTSSLTVGSHSITVGYQGDSMHAGGYATDYQQVLAGYPTTTTLAATPNPSLVGQTVNFTTHVTTATGTLTGSVTLSEGSTVFDTEPVGSGTIMFSLNSLAAGTHNLVATYTGDSTHTASSSSLTQQVLAGYPTTTSLTSSANPAQIGASVTLTARVTAGAGTPGGTPAPAGAITFTDGATALGTQPLVGGVASLPPLTTLSRGTHTITATYNPASTYTASNSVLTQTINGSPVIASFTGLPNPAYALQPIVFSIHVAPATVTVVPTGPVQLWQSVPAAGDSVVGTATLDASGNATLTQRLPPGTTQFYILYQGDTVFDPSGSALNPPARTSVTVLPIATQTALALPSGTLYAFQQIPLAAHVAINPAIVLSAPVPLTGTVNFFSGATLLGSAPVNASGDATLPTAFPAGTFNVSATYVPGSVSGATIFTGSSSASGSITFQPDSTTTTLTATPLNAFQRQTVTFTVTTLAAHSSLVPAGVLTLDEGATSIPLTLDATGRATFATALLSVGMHTFTATYAGNVNQLGSISNTVTVTISPSDFTLQPPPSITVQAEHHITFNVAATSIGNFADSVILSCNNLPDHATCSFPKGRTFALTAGSSSSLQVTLETSDVEGYKSGTTALNPSRRAIPLLALLLPTTLLLFRHKCRNLPKLLLLAFATVATLSALNGCTGKLPGFTPPGNYTLQMTGAAGTLSHTVPLTLHVTAE